MEGAMDGSSQDPLIAKQRTGCCGLLANLKLWNYKRVGDGTTAKDDGVNNLAMQVACTDSGLFTYCSEFGTPVYHSHDKYDMNQNQKLCIDPAEGEETLLGINLTSEAFFNDHKRDVCLGIITVVPQRLSLWELRNLLATQLCTLPGSYSFITKQGWPVAASQERDIRVSQILTDGAVIRLQRIYDKPRIGVKTSDGVAIGFIFAEHNSTVSSIRDAIRQQLGFIGSQEGGTYQFIDRNDWPVASEQEGCLSLMDLVVTGSIKLCPQVFNFTDALGPSHDIPDSSDDSLRKRKRLEGLRQLTFRSSKDLDRPSNFSKQVKELQAKQILISYVRAEAAQHALSLKEELTEMGFSVYLDVHEIKSGIDWQDALNFAVSECEVFVPLVTTRYGETQWTNREVKLADVLSKLIVPINFQDYWPPKCLAIQFATTQFIRWRAYESSDHLTPGHLWHDPEVQNVSRQIAERVRQADAQRHAKLNKRASVLRSCPVDIPDGYTGLSRQVSSAPREGPPLIVISLHPQQQAFGDDLKTMLEAEGYEVWLSTCVLGSATPNGIDAKPLHRLEAPDKSPCSQTCSQPLLSSSDTLPLSQTSFGSFDTTESLTDSIGSPDTDKHLRFQEKADEAGIIIFILSKAFAESRTCQQQVFYCEHRKRVIPLNYEEFCMPGWMSLLIGTGIFEDARSEGYKLSLINRVSLALDPNETGDLEGKISEEKIDSEVRLLRKLMPKDVCVYVAGSTSFFHRNSEAICRSIGKNLANVEGIQLVTGGFFGVGETVGQSYDEEKRKNVEQSQIWHILPHRDDHDRSQQSRQNKDRTFKKVPYGKTLFSGESVREREVIVARAFDICILVEGGPGAAHEAEQFAWNDHVVIPIKRTGGAASGKFNVPDKIFKVPQGVEEEDWVILEDRKATPEDIGKAVANIVTSVKERLKLDSPTYAGTLTSPLKSPGALARQRTALPRMKTFVFKSNASLKSPTD